MNPRATLALLVVTLLAVGGLIFLRVSVPASRDREEKARYAMVFDPSDIDRIEIQRGQDTIRVQRENMTWRMTSPAEDRASPEAVDRLLSTARFLEVRDRAPISEGTLLADSGLKTPRFRLRLQGSRDQQLDLGGESTVPGQVFARLGDEDSLLRVPGTLVELVSAPADSFRDPRLTDLVPDDIDKFTVRRADGEMTLRRERGRWIIEKPVRTDADPRAVAAFLDPLLGLRITGFTPPSSTADGSETLPGRTAAIALTTRSGSEAEIEISRGSGTGEQEQGVTARFAPRGGPLAVDAAALVIFDVSPEALRDRTLGYVDADTVDRIVLSSGGRELTVARDGDGWVAREDGRTLETSLVTGLIDAFNATRVDTFRPPAEADQTGLNPPSETVTFYAWLSENSAEESAGGQVLAHADLGQPASEKTVYARTARDGETVTVDGALSEIVRRLLAPPENPAR